MAIEPKISPDQMHRLYEDQLKLNDAYQEILTPENGLNTKVAKMTKVVRQSNEEMNELLNSAPTVKLIDPEPPHLITPFALYPDLTNSSDILNDEVPQIAQNGKNKSQLQRIAISAFNAFKALTSLIANSVWRAVCFFKTRLLFKTTEFAEPRPFSKKHLD